jgi:hypothetical protein
MNKEQLNGKKFKHSTGSHEKRVLSSVQLDETEKIIKSHGNYGQRRF